MLHARKELFSRVTAMNAHTLAIRLPGIFNFLFLLRLDRFGSERCELVKAANGPTEIGDEYHCCIVPVRSYLSCELGPRGDKCKRYYNKLSLYKPCDKSKTSCVLENKVYTIGLPSLYMPKRETPCSNVTSRVPLRPIRPKSTNKTNRSR
jgi:hypothetical protein